MDPSSTNHNGYALENIAIKLIDKQLEICGLLNQDITLGATTEEELFCFLKNLQQYCDEVGINIGIGPLEFSSSHCQGDVLDLLKHLKQKSVDPQL